MASKTAPQKTTGSSVPRPTRSLPPALIAALSARFEAALLPAEAADFPAADLAEAARFTLSAAMERAGDEPTVTIDSVLGETRRFLRIALINDDRPFLVDSIAATVAAQGLAIDRLVHPVMPVRRDEAGLLLEILPAPLPTARRESLIYLETDRADSRTRNALATALAATLSDVQAAVTDWPRMQGAMLTDAARVTDPDGADLLRWLASGMFTQLGHVTRRRDGSQQGALGICRKSARRLLAPESYDRAFAWFDAALAEGRDAHAPLAIKANLIANVHRRVPLDLLIVPQIETTPEADAIAALSVHAGVWTSSALGSPPASVPRLSARLATLMDKLAINPQGHTGKSLVHALTVLPHDLMISFGDDDLERVATTMMSQVDRPRPRLLLVRAPLARHLFAFVWLPRDAISTRVRLQIAAMLSEAAIAPVIDWSMTVEGSDLALLRFVLDIRANDESGGSTGPDEPALNTRLEAMVRGWTQAVEAELAKHEDPARAAAIAARYAEAFPGDYRASNGPVEAARDIVALRAITGRTRAARLLAAKNETDDGAGLRLKLYQREGSIVLSDAVPVLENFGFRVLDERPTVLGGTNEGGGLGTIHDFQLDPPVGVATATVMARAGAVEAALGAVLNAAAEDDAFNRLIVTSGLSAQEADWLRAWFRYLRQAGLGYGVATVVEALRNAGEVTAALIAAFRARHDPGFTGDRQSGWLDAQERVRLGLSNVAAINDDRLLRAFRALVDAILRTNAFAPAPNADGPEALAFKLDSAMVPGLPRPLPWREIFVYSRRVEGIHLRAGPVARGGLRWSDRRDDFRTEVLGLMKAQRVKNAVIVPTGAKGGFYPKQLPDMARDRPETRDAWLAEGKASYQVFIRTLLSITDNIVEGKVVHPDGVVIRDGEDPYFVVAADKGTATFSDTANALAEAQDFWLDDAFASGGSKGYDHKAMGITAKGAWLSVQRHFLELGLDVQADPVRVVGVGDMSGDVFGNGMLLSKTLKVVAAFDHRHIFLDPDPDPAQSWTERARMFALPRSSWDDYDRAAISPGGGVFPRTMKAIPLAPEVRAALDVTVAEMDPETLIATILRAPADLLWFGGIGTYIKAASENNATVGDPANDAVRVDAEQLRVRVIGEGANLGTTQAARIAFSLAGGIGPDGRPTGGRVNTDFIDNSAGVDCSDNEVNIKIALASAKRAGRLSERGRVSLLVSMTDAVAAHVLEDNRLQALALSIAERPRAAATASYARLIDLLEESGDLDRRTEGLADAEHLTRRAAEGHGLTRPELAVLLSSAKLVLQRALEDSSVVDDPGLVGELLCAFPEPMRGKFRRDIVSHRLRREIIATRIANRLINRMGMLHPFELAEEEGAVPAQVAAAFVAAERLFNMDAVWHALETAAMPETARILLFDRAAAALSSHMADLLRVGAGTVPPTRLVTELGKQVTSLSDAAATLLAAEPRAQSDALCARLVAVGAPAAEAAMIVHLFDLDGAAGIAMLARDSDTAAPALTGAFIEIGARLGLDWAQQTAEGMNPSDPWERLLVNGLARDFQHMRLHFLRRVAKGRKDPVPAATRWLDTHAAAIEQFRALVGRARGASPVTPVMLAQLASQARGLLAK